MVFDKSVVPFPIQKNNIKKRKVMPIPDYDSDYQIDDYQTTSDKDDGTFDTFKVYKKHIRKFNNDTLEMILSGKKFFKNLGIVRRARDALFRHLLTNNAT